MANSVTLHDYLASAHFAVSLPQGTGPVEKAGERLKASGIHIGEGLFDILKAVAYPIFASIGYLFAKIALAINGDEDGPQELQQDCLNAIFNKTPIAAFDAVGHFAAAIEVLYQEPASSGTGPVAQAGQGMRRFVAAVAQGFSRTTSTDVPAAATTMDRKHFSIVDHYERFLHGLGSEETSLVDPRTLQQ